MPRVIDLTKGNETDWNKVRLPAPVYGEREIRAEEIDAIVRAFNKPILGFWPQFTSRGKGDTPKHEVLQAAHAWLSDNATGPWLWQESWSNHGHSLDTHVYVEREPDQKAFADAHPDLFRFHAHTDFELGGLALERGVIAPLTAKESFSVWSSEMKGFQFLISDDLGADGWRFAITHPELERRFAERWGHLFSVAEAEGRACYEGVHRSRDHRESLAVWLDRNAGIGSLSRGPNETGDRVWTVETRYPDVAEALARDWGHVFEADADGARFVASEYPKTPERRMPADFKAYLRGETEEYEAPYLPDSLRAFREVPAAPSASI